jgi:ABC-2 type transport system permease protein
MWSRASAIVWAQWRTLWNHFPRSNKSSLAFTGLLSAAWYALFAYLAVIAAILLSSPEEIESFRKTLPAALLLCFLYWQLIPVLMASMGSSLDIRKLLVYPIPHGDLFTLEVLLRISSGVEMLILLVGAAAGLWLNPKIPAWAPLALLLFAAFNLCCSAGIRDVLVRLLARRRVREIVVFLLVLAAALPQILFFGGAEGRLRQALSGEPAAFWPWTATARLASGDFSFTNLAVLLVWTGAAYLFGRWQFERGLRFDSSEAAAHGLTNRRAASRIEWFYRLPNFFFPDPLAALVEKELRFLSRAPRFRLVFLMGFSFGLLIWAPMALGNTGSPHPLFLENFLTLVTVYALLLLSDALFWNCFGFDRGASQIYFLVPVKITTVLAGKNLAAGFFVVLEMTAIAAVSLVLHLPVTAMQILEALFVAAVVTLFLLSIGNLSSVYNPRPVNPAKSFRTASGGRTQALMMLIFPAALIPVALAYVARYAFNTEWAFFAVLAASGILGGLVYFYSLGSAVRAAGDRKEQLITSLSQGPGPIES